MKLVVNTGSMFSGKSTELLRQGERHLIAGHKVVFIKPQMDTRYSASEIVNHKGDKVTAIPVPIDGDILQYVPYDTNVVLIDEVQFFGSTITYQIETLVQNGVTVYCSGLDMDFEGKPFYIVSRLLALADEINKFHAVCSNCGQDAVYSAKLDNSSHSRIELGEKDKYKPLCRKCYYEFVKKQLNEKYGLLTSNKN